MSICKDSFNSCSKIQSQIYCRKLLSSPKGSEISLSARDRYKEIKTHRFFAPLCYLIVFLTVLVNQETKMTLEVEICSAHSALSFVC